MRNVILLLLVFQCIITSCKKDNRDNETKQPGFFVLKELKGNLKSGNQIQSIKTTQTGYDLGDIKASRNYSFILTNGGNQPIFDIQLSTDNKSFVISPVKIDKLESNSKYDNTSNTGFIPIITMGVIHGTQLNGVGYTRLLPLDLNSSTLTISGKTIKDNDTISISANFDFSVNAKIMDIELYENDVKIDLTKNYGGMSTTLGGLGFMRTYTVKSGLLEVENIGNVSIDLSYGSNHVVIEPKVKTPLEIQGSVIFILDGDGTITDNNRIQLGDDGKGYFYIGAYK